MPYDSLIDRTDAGALIPEATSREIIQGMAEASAVMRMARRLPDMPTSKLKMPVLSVLPMAYFVDGDTGLKQTTEVKWQAKYLYAEEIAGIVPIPEAVLDDSDYDIWAEVKPLVVEAMGLVFDQAVLYGTDAPATWPDDVLTAAAAANNVVSLATVTGGGGDLYDALLGEEGTISLLEAEGFIPNGHIGAMTMRGKMRGLRDADKQPIFTRSMQDKTRYELDGERIEFPRNGAVDPTQSLLVSGDFTQLVYSLRQDVRYKMLTEGVINDAAGNIIYNFGQQDMVGLRTTMRIAWQVPNPVNRMEETEADRYPCAVLTP